MKVYFPRSAAGIVNILGLGLEKLELSSGGVALPLALSGQRPQEQVRALHLFPHFLAQRH